MAKNHDEYDPALWTPEAEAFHRKWSAAERERRQIADYERLVARSYELDRVREISRRRGRLLIEQHRLRLAAERENERLRKLLDDAIDGCSTEWLIAHIDGEDA